MKVLLTLMVAFFLHTSLTVTSTSFPKDGLIPSKYTCDGTNLSPSLQIQDLPKGTKTMALIIHDPDAPMEGGITHWIVWNIPPTKSIPENLKGGIQGMNGANQTGYTGPCPPSGKHHYHFNVYALDTELLLSKNTNKDQLEKAMEGHILSEGNLIGLYERKKEVSDK
ncbi:MAG: YbhB/YbcL family Raf kinase inhibitor-like protein [Bacteroidetes bacterium]|nr:YbhB/YbcL family Raf kinase inhibitor-like protein [Bacteroidota bacterium]